jgi:hypothetical protein
MRLFLLINGLIAIFLVIRLVLAVRKRIQVFRFEIRPGEGGLYGPRGTGATNRGGDQPSERSLNLWFNCNGHMWDAYQVLGVPAGASREVCFSAFEKLARSKIRDTDFMDALEKVLRTLPPST